MYHKFGLRQKDRRWSLGGGVKNPEALFSLWRLWLTLCFRIKLVFKRLWWTTDPNLPDMKRFQKSPERTFSSRTHTLP